MDRPRKPFQLATGRDRRVPLPSELEPPDRLDTYKEQARSLLASVQADAELFPQEVHHFLLWLQVEAQGEGLR